MEGVGSVSFELSAEKSVFRAAAIGPGLSPTSSLPEPQLRVSIATEITNYILQTTKLLRNRSRNSRLSVTQTATEPGRVIVFRARRDDIRPESAHAVRHVLTLEPKLRHPVLSEDLRREVAVGVALRDRQLGRVQTRARRRRIPPVLREIRIERASRVDCREAIVVGASLRVCRRGGGRIDGR